MKAFLSNNVHADIGPELARVQSAITSKAAADLDISDVRLRWDESLMAVERSGTGAPKPRHADGAILDWDHAPEDLREAFDRGATFAAWNASGTLFAGAVILAGFELHHRQSAA